MSKLKRKNKPYHFLSYKKRPHKAIREAFALYHLDDVREEIELWKEISLSNDSGVYEDGESRENLLFYCKNLLKLVEALYIIKEKRSPDNKKMPKAIIAIIEQYNKPKYLNDEEQQNPLIVLQQHFNKFSFAYSKIELRDMLESVISYGGKREVNKNCIIVSYRCLKILIQSAHKIAKRKKA